ncbi:hypothetical protein [Flavobacterium sp.]|jgi:hypothetical protein|uniref:hypothetical protein n=1 Tax=Flavobacterium sp. TaxID=239 RepID=UPI0037BE58EB
MTQAAQLVRYEHARTALAECYRVDEVKDIRDKAEAMAAYARQAKDSELIQYATEIKVRAERRCGELLATTEKNRGAAGVGSNQHQVRSHDSTAPTLAEMGLTRDESSRYQQLAAMPDEHFETAVATAKATAGEVTTAFMLREAKKAKPAPIKGKAAEKKRQELREAQERGVSMLCTYARLTLSAIESLEEFTDEERQVLDDLRTAIDRTSIIH